ncbi:hypothetical protein Scep_017052 [Stephania cephalantha]|uniref:Uncharacterized protein n=1 Tax=Stephania cephalantha TaxID=152367 RepID=A0AAP0NUP8_9MAGN
MEAEPPWPTERGTGEMVRRSPLSSKPIGVGVGSQPQHLTKKKKKNWQNKAAALSLQRI